MHPGRTTIVRRPPRLAARTIFSVSTRGATSLGGFGADASATRAPRVSPYTHTPLVYTNVRDAPGTAECAATIASTALRSRSWNRAELSAAQCTTARHARARSDQLAGASR